MKLSVDLSRKMYDLHMTGDYRYRIAYGGRAGQKTYGNADMSILRMCQRETHFAVLREYKNTIKSSVHKAICERIKALNVSASFDITDTHIKHLSNGSNTAYYHLHENADEVTKGLEGVDVAWLFEGHELQKESWKYLNPTVRRTPRMIKDPEVWIEFNPEYEDDFVYQEFIVNHHPQSKVVFITYLDNPWCPEDTKRQAEECRMSDIDEYNHVWLGHPRNVGGLIYPVFGRDIHIRHIDLERIEKTANFFMGQDPHTTYYPACVWMARQPRGDGTFDFYFYNEWPTRGTFGGKMYHELRKEKKCTLTLRQRAQMFKILDNTTDKTYNSIEIEARGIDTRFAKGSGTGSTTNNTRGIIIEMADIANGGLRFETPPEHMIDVQRDNMRELLGWDSLRPMHRMNEPKMYVAPHCENLIAALQFHRFDRTGKEKEEEKYKDFVDAAHIAMATAQQHPHRDRTAKPIEFEVETDNVSSLIGAFYGKSDQ
jgi:hypothetical protein